MSLRSASVFSHNALGGAEGEHGDEGEGQLNHHDGVEEIVEVRQIRDSLREDRHSQRRRDRYATRHQHSLPSRPSNVQEALQP